MQKASQPVYPCEPANYDQETIFRAKYWLQCTGNDGSNVAISQSLHHTSPTNGCTGAERIPCISGPIKPIQG